MRWIWIDKFVEFESGRFARAIKNVSLAEEHLHDHFPGYPVMPNSLITEGLAQTGGLLIGEQLRFEELVVLAKIPKAVYHFPAVAGDQLIYTTQIEYLKEDGAMVSGTCTIGNRVQAELELVYAFLRDERAGTALDPKNFIAMMKVLGVLDIVRSNDGVVPPLTPGLTQLRAMTERTATERTASERATTERTERPERTEVAR